MKRKRRFRFVRRASAVVEVAVMAPLLMTAMFGMVEVGQAYNVKQAVTLAAREGARAGSLPGGTQADVDAAVADAMTGPGLTGYSVTSNVSTMQPTDTQVSVSVTMPFDRATFTGNLLGGGSFNISSTAVMRREGVDASSGGSGIDPG